MNYLLIALKWIENNFWCILGMIIIFPISKAIKNAIYALIMEALTDYHGHQAAYLQEEKDFNDDL